MPLTGPQLGRIHQTILAAFDRAEFTRVMLTCMDVKLDDVVAPDDFSAQVFEFVGWADRQKRILDLVKCLHEERPADADLAALHADAQDWAAVRPPGPAAPSAAAPPAAAPAPPAQRGGWVAGALGTVVLAAIALLVWQPWKPASGPSNATPDAALLAAAPIEETTPLPAEETTATAVDEATVAPVEETTPTPAEETTATPVEEATAAPVEETTTPTPVEEVTATPVEEATALPVEAAATGDVWTETISGINFVRVPAGEFTMGSDDGSWDERPPHKVDMDEYWIGLTEVTNAQFRPFVEGGGYDDQSLWTEAGWQWRINYGVTQPDGWNHEDWNRPGYPVVWVSWYEAAAYAAWLSRESGWEIRLPSEAEWEKAACGTDGRIYPWGDQSPDRTRANFDGNVSRPTAAGSYPAGASPYGALDMAGNVYEWTNSLYRPYPYDEADGREDPEDGGRTLRGGSFSRSASSVRCAYRDDFNPDFRFDDFGFRVMSPGF